MVGDNGCRECIGKSQATGWRNRQEGGTVAAVENKNLGHVIFHEVRAGRKTRIDRQSPRRPDPNPADGRD